MFRTKLLKKQTSNLTTKLLKNHRTHLLFSSNTNIGKTLITTGLVRSSLLESHNNIHCDKSLTRYLKPLQAGAGHDEYFVRDNMADIERVISSFETEGQSHALECKTLYCWDTPASPHSCCRIENKPVEEDTLVEKVREYLCFHDNKRLEECFTNSTTFIETAGGVLSPGPSSPLHDGTRHAGLYGKSWGWSTQGDIYSSLGVPVILIGDGQLGGISATLSSIESLLIRGYDIDMIAIVQQENDNISAIREYLSERLFNTKSGSGKTLLSDPTKDIVSIPPIPPSSLSLHDWYSQENVLEVFHTMHTRLNEKWNESLEHKHQMLEDGMKQIWWPFTQHATEESCEQKLVDRASGDYYSVVTRDDVNKVMEQRMVFDGPASWWTQGLGHGNSSSALTIAAAAGRYGHVLFPSLLNEPSITLSKLLVNNTNWASRSFFSDDGSTAVEVAIKMALKLYQSRHSTKQNLTCIAHEDCYHGDTLGAMNVAVPSIFNEGQQPWFQSKGCFLKSPCIGFRDGRLTISFDGYHDDVQKGEDKNCPFMKYKRDCKTISGIYDVEYRLKHQKELYGLYREYICQKWNEYEQSTEKPTIAFTFIEPLVLGAGGMKFIDPLYQRALLDESKHRNIPIVYDEIFTGLYRLGNTSSNTLTLGVIPDIACYSKLLTGGLVPLGITLATQEVFDCFLGDDKASALLHGHSYTAYPVGCASAIHALETYETYFKSHPNKVYFDEEDVWTLSTSPIIQESFALGTVLVIKVQPKDLEVSSAGYGAKSERTSAIIQLLWQRGIYSRPLGNVIYIMVSPLTETEECERLCAVLSDVVREVMHLEHDS